MRTIVICSIVILLNFAQTQDAERKRQDRLNAYVANGSVNHVADSATVAGNDARPLAQAVRALSDEFGWTIDFEDPPFYSASDLVDDTAPEWRATHPNDQGVTVIAGGAFRSQFPGNPVSMAEEEHVLDTVVADYNRSGNPGRFSVVKEDDGRFSVIGTHVKDDQGQDQPVSSILDTLVTVPTETRTAYKTVSDILVALSAKTKVNIGPGTVPLNLMLESKATIGGQNIPARTLLTQTLNSLDVRLSWHLYYDADVKSYALNLLPVKVPSQSAN